LTPSPACSGVHANLAVMRRVRRSERGTCRCRSGDRRNKNHLSSYDSQV